MRRARVECDSFSNTTTRVTRRASGDDDGITDMYGVNKCLAHSDKASCVAQKADWLYEAEYVACEWVEACTGVPTGQATCGDKDGIGPSNAPLSDADCPSNFVVGQGSASQVGIGTFHEPTDKSSISI